MSNRFSFLSLLTLGTWVSAIGQVAPSPPEIGQLPKAPAPDLIGLPSQITPENRLSLRQAVATGLKNNPQIAAAKFSVVSARENYNSQKAPLNPTLSYAAINNSYAPLSLGNGFNSGSNYTATVILETNGANGYRARQARELYNQAKFDAQTTGLSLKLAIINAYTNLQVANRALEIELKVYKNILQLSDLTDKRFQAGAGPEADSVRAHIAAIQEQQNVITDVANVNLARSSLNQQLGRPQDGAIDASDPLNYAPEIFADLKTLTLDAEAQRPELKSAIANLESLKAVPGLQRSQYFPNVVIAHDFTSDNTVYVGLAIPIDLGGIRGEVSRASADIKTQRAQVELERQAVDQDVKSSYINYVAAKKQVDTYEGGILKLSETLVDQIRHGYELGANTIVDILTAENTYRSVETAYYQAIGSSVLAAYTLKHSIGDLPDAESNLLYRGPTGQTETWVSAASTKK